MRALTLFSAVFSGSLLLTGCLALEEKQWQKLGEICNEDLRCEDELVCRSTANLGERRCIPERTCLSDLQCESGELCRALSEGSERYCLAQSSTSTETLPGRSCQLSGDCPQNGRTCHDSLCKHSCEITDTCQTNFLCGDFPCGSQDEGYLCLVDGDCFYGNCCPQGASFSCNSACAPDLGDTCTPGSTTGCEIGSFCHESGFCTKICTEERDCTSLDGKALYCRPNSTSSNEGLCFHECSPQKSCPQGLSCVFGLCR